MMKRITVYANDIALVLKRGKLIDVLTEGRYWIGFKNKVVKYNTLVPVQVGLDFEAYLDNPVLQMYLNVVSVEDNQIGFEKREGLFTRVIYPGKMAYWHSPVKYDCEIINIDNYEVDSTIPKEYLMKPEVLSFLKVFPVNKGHVGALYVDGEYIKLLDPGVYYYWKFNKAIQVITMDMRAQEMPVPAQEILTKDKAGIRVNFLIKYKIIDAEKALNENKEYAVQLYTTIQLALREYLGQYTLDQLLANKESVGKYILEIVDKEMKELGVDIINAGIKDIILPGDVKDIMNQVLIAQKKAQANTIMRQEETASTRSLLNTAKLMQDNAMLLKLKEMEYMEKIAEKIGEITVHGGGTVLDQFKELVV